MNDILWVWQKDKLLNGLHFWLPESSTKWTQSGSSVYTSQGWLKSKFISLPLQYSLLLYLLNPPILYYSVASNIIFIHICPFVYVFQSLHVCPPISSNNQFSSPATLIFFNYFFLKRSALIVPVNSEYCGKGLYLFITLQIPNLTLSLSPSFWIKIEELFMISLI